MPISLIRKLVSNVKALSYRIFEHPATKSNSIG